MSQKQYMSDALRRGIARDVFRELQAAGEHELPLTALDDELPNGRSTIKRIARASPLFALDRRPTRRHPEGRVYIGLTVQGASCSGLEAIDDVFDPSEVTHR